MGSDHFNNLINAPILLGRKVAVIKQPIIHLAVFMLVSHDIDRDFQQLQHLIAFFNASGLFFDAVIREIHTGKVDGLQKVLDTAANLHLKPSFDLLHRQLQR